jgi:Nucleotidyl transferase AbiEii toxin, Type IV TA system
VKTTLQHRTADRRTPASKTDADQNAPIDWYGFSPRVSGRDVHERMLRKSAELSAYWKRGDMAQPLDVIRILSAAKVSFVLVGAYGLAGWRKEGRATEDIDLVVAQRHLKKATQLLCAAFPQLEAIDLPVVIRLRDRATHDVAIDLMKPVQQPYCEAFKHTHTVTEGKQRYRVPSLEMALIMKFAALVSPYRATADKYRDLGDFVRILENNPDYDREKLMELADLVYVGGGKEILELARQALAGEKLIV